MKPLKAQKQIQVHENDLLTATAQREEWEEAIFRNAAHFNVFRLQRRRLADQQLPLREVRQFATFPRALAAAGNTPELLVYAVTKDGASFCIPRKEWEKYAQVWLEMGRSGARFL